MGCDELETGWCSHVFDYIYGKMEGANSPAELQPWFQKCYGLVDELVECESVSVSGKQISPRITPGGPISQASEGQIRMASYGESD